jgi:hypothetical protein
LFSLSSKEKISSFYEELGHDLIEKRQYLDAALVFGELVNKPDERFLSLCKAKAWDEAMRIKSMYEIAGSGNYLTKYLRRRLTQKCFSFVDQMLKFEVTNHYSSMLSDIETAQEQTSQYTSRLLIVRAEKAKRIEEEGGI